MTPPPISKQTIQSLLFNSGVDVGVCDVQMPDPLYALPGLLWITGAFAGSFQKFSRSMVGGYTEGCSDCDDFAQCAKFYADYCHRRSPNRAPGCGIAFAEFWYRVNGSGNGHAINAFAYHDTKFDRNGVLSLGFFDPQTCRIVNLSRAEVNSGHLVKF